VWVVVGLKTSIRAVNPNPNSPDAMHSAIVAQSGVMDDFLIGSVVMVDLLDCRLVAFSVVPLLCGMLRCNIGFGRYTRRIAEGSSYKFQISLALFVVSFFLRCL
jgi:hypothetical protein